MPHKFFAAQFREAQLVIAEDIPKVLWIPQLQGDVELTVQALETNTPLKGSLQVQISPKTVNHMAPKQQNKLKNRCPRLIPRNNTPTKKLNKRWRRENYSSVPFSSPLDSKQKDRQPQRSRSPKRQKIQKKVAKKAASWLKA